MSEQSGEIPAPSESHQESPVLPLVQELSEQQRAQRESYTKPVQDLLARIREGNLTEEDATKILTGWIGNRDLLNQHHREKIGETKGRLAEARIDTLTGLPTRRVFEEDLQGFLAEGVSFGFIMTDIDHFKKINDAHGHSGGDDVLRALANKLDDGIRHTDYNYPVTDNDRNDPEFRSDRIYRWGGEEIAILMPGLTEPEILLKRAEILRELVKETPYVVNPNSEQSEHVKVTASLGAGIFNGSANSDTFFKEVDNALYDSKEHGRDQTTVVGTSV